MLKSLRKRKEIFGMIKRDVIKYKKDLLICILAITLSIPFQIIFPYLYKRLVDDVMINKQFNLVYWISLLYLIVFLLQTVVDGLIKKAQNTFNNKISLFTKLKIWANYLGMSYKDISKYSVGDLKMRVDDDSLLLQEFVNDQIINYTFSMLKSIVYSVIIFSIRWQIAVVTLIAIPLSILISNYFSQKSKEIFTRFRGLNGEYNNWIHNSLQNWKEVKALALEKREMAKFVKYRHKFALLRNRWIIIFYFNIIVRNIKNDFVFKMGIYFISAIFVIRGQLTIGAVLMFISYVSDLYLNIESIVTANVNMITKSESYKRMFEILQLDNGGQLEHNTATRLTGDIVFENVSYNYEGFDDVLENISFTIRPNKINAFVGKSGSGKTTIIKLLLKIIEPQAGEILVDGRNLNEIGDRELYANLGVVPQDSYLFNMTIYDNLLLANPRASKGDIIRACKNACIHDFIDSLADKYETVIGEKGVKLSGGQRQRLAIARVFLRNPQICIFDEATASLDHESERVIHNNIATELKDKTIIIIAHRLSTIANADNIIVLEDKKLSGYGTYDYLLENNSLFRELTSGSSR